MVQRPKVKTYQAWTMSEALSFVKEDLGPDAVILHTRTFDRGGFLGFGRRAVVEITAARADELPARQSAKSVEEPRAAAATAAPRSGTEAARIGAAARAYGSMPAAAGAAASAQRTSPAVAITPQSIDMEAEREKTRRLAQAMMIRLERESAERAAAAVNEQATLRAAERFGFRARELQPVQPAAAPAAAPVFSTAQRFVLVPEPTVGASGAMRMTAAVVRRPEPMKDAVEEPAEKIVGSVVAEKFERFVETPVAARDARDDERAALLGPSRVEAPPVVVDTVRVHAVASPPPAVAEERAAVGSTAEDECAHTHTVEVEAPVRQPEPAPMSASERRAARRPIDPIEPSAPAVPARSSELDDISEFVGRVLASGPVERPDPAPHRAAAAAPAPAGPARSPELEAMYAQLIEQEVARELADRILREVEAELDGTSPEPSAVRAAVEQRIAALIPASGADAFRIVPGRHGPRRIAFVGPTGVGKTTTLAKIAAQLKLKRGLRVGIVAADTYRIAAVDQLRTYAEILGLPVEVAASPSDAARACADLADVDVILIDTAGRSQNDCMKLSELRAFLASAQPDETHLVLSATAGMKTLEREAKAFGEVGVDRIVLTKLDEAAAFGTLVSLVDRLGKQVSFLTHGQEVPDHIEPARGTRLAALVLGSEVR